MMTYTKEVPFSAAVSATFLFLGVPRDLPRTHPTSFSSETEHQEFPEARSNYTSKRQHVFSVRELGERHDVSSVFGKDVLGDLKHVIVTF